jgi:polyisoprenoid-binding protein YceI
VIGTGDSMAKRYLLDPQRSRFTVQAFAAGVLGGFAHDPKFAIRRFVGEMRFDPESPADSSFAMTVQSSSLELTGNAREKDRAEIQNTTMDEVLEAQRFPEISFKTGEIVTSKIADNWFRAQLRGDMTLHGITRSLSIDSQLRLAERELRLGGEFSIQFAQYNLKRVTGLGGLIKLKDELKFEFDLLAQLQE